MHAQSKARHLAFIEAVVHSMEAVHSDLLTTQVNAYIMHIAYWLHRWMHIVAARLVWYYTTWRQSYCMRSILILQNRPPAVIQGTSSDAHRILARVSDQGEVEFMVMSLDWHNSNFERTYPLEARTNRTMHHSDACATDKRTDRTIKAQGSHQLDGTTHHHMQRSERSEWESLVSFPDTRPNANEPSSFGSSVKQSKWMCRSGDGDAGLKDYVTATGTFPPDR